MKTALIGCGHIAETHWQALRRLPEVRVVGVVDREVERALEFSQSHRAEGAFQDLDELIRKKRPDVIHILTPPKTHRDLAVQAMRAGCHVLVEKPMASNTSDCKAMAAVAEQEGIQLGVCHNYEFVPAFQKAVAMLNDGRLGHVRSVEVYWRTTFSPATRKGAGRWIENLRGGIFHEVAPHLVYLARAVVSDLEVTACSVRDLEGRHPELRALLESSSGPVVLGISTATSPVQKFIRILGSRMSLHVDLTTGVLLCLKGRPDGLVSRAKTNLELARQLSWGTIVNAARLSTGRLPRGHEVLIRRFYEAVSIGDSPPSGYVEGIAVASVLEQLWQAIEAGSN